MINKNIQFIEYIDKGIKGIFMDIYYGKIHICRYNKIKICKKRKYYNMSESQLKFINSKEL